MVKTQIEAGALQRLAEVAATEVLDELGIKAECVYLGQATGPESNRAYILDPRGWIVEGGARAPQQTIAFEWRWDEGVAVVEQLCNNAQQRGVRKPTKDLWCKGALEKLHTAAKAFADMHGPSILDEFGLQVKCEYKYQDETMEHDLVAWKVQGRRSRCKAVSNCRYLE